MLPTGMPSEPNRCHYSVKQYHSAYGYLGFTTLSTFDTAKCAAKCGKLGS